MTVLLKKALEALSSLNELPEDDQNAIAGQILVVLEQAMESETAGKEFGGSTVQRSTTTPGNRTAGLELGRIIIAADFDEPLPDSFWLGEE